MKLQITITLLIVLLALACTSEKKNMKYQVRRITEPIEINAEWDKKPWNDIQAVELMQYMGEKPGHFPKTQAKMAYDADAVYIIFRVEDQYVKAVCEVNQGPVYKDSCVEFFFTPEEDVKTGYFNLEMNCGGTMLFHHQSKPRSGSEISENDIEEIEVAHSLPKIVDPEIEDQTTWSVEYRIPFSVLGNYHEFDVPVAGDIWRGNFYKCADDTSHPHWLMWAPIDYPKPNFHAPEFFGNLEFL